MSGTRMRIAHRIVIALGAAAIVLTAFALPYSDPGHDEFAWLATEPDEGLRTTYAPVWRKGGPWTELDARRLVTWWSDIVAACALAMLVAAPSREKGTRPSSLS